MIQDYNFYEIDCIGVEKKPKNTAIMYSAKSQNRTGDLSYYIWRPFSL